MEDFVVVVSFYSSLQKGYCERLMAVKRLMKRIDDVCSSCRYATRVKIASYNS